MAKKIGIDLGTTYSVVSYVGEDGTIHNIESSEGEKTTPSVVFFDPDGQTVVVGSTAREAGALNPERLVERVKNYMGDASYMKEIDGKQLSACAISSLILKKLISDAEIALQGEEIEGAVITCPAYFGDSARAATREAGENVTLSNGQKLKVLKLMDEPTAAAIAYGNSHQENMHKTVLIYDLGGGTFDCTVMKLDFEGSDRKYQVITTGGDHKLGGKDWDKALTDYIRSEFCSATGCDEEAMKNDPEMIAWFSENTERTKKLLTQKDTATMTPSFDGSKERIEITREKFDELTSKLFRQTIMLINEMLSKAQMTMDQIDEIILVGGSTRMRQVTDGLTAEYNKPITMYDPDKAVSNGAALVASGINADSNFGAEQASSGAGASGAGASGSDSSSGGFSLGGGTSFVGKDGAKEEVIEICNKSYCIRYFSGGSPVYLNLVIKDTQLPAFGSTDDTGLKGNLRLGGGDDTGMTSCVNLRVLENTSKERDVTEEECEAIYEDEAISFDPPVSATALVAVELVVDFSGQLTLKLVESETGAIHEVHPRRKDAEKVTAGVEEVSGFTLG